MSNQSRLHYYFLTENINNNGILLTIDNCKLYMYKDFRGFTNEHFTNLDILSLISISLLNFLNIKFTNINFENVFFIETEQMIEKTNNSTFDFISFDENKTPIFWKNKKDCKIKKNDFLIKNDSIIKKLNINYHFTDIDSLKKK